MCISCTNNWLGKLELNFFSRNGHSILNRCRHIGPFLVQKSFYPYTDKHVPHVYLLHPPGGLVGGDRLVLDVQLEQNSQALLTTPAASKFYRTNCGLYIYQKNIFKLSNNSILEWVPQNSIFFPQTNVKVDTIFILEKGACIIFFEILCFRNMILNSFGFPEKVSIFLNINLQYSIGLQERLQVCALDYQTKLSKFDMIGSFFAVPSDKKILHRVRELIQLTGKKYVGGVTLLGEVLAVRLLGNDYQDLNKTLCDIWSVVRFHIIGKRATIPRIWLT